MRATNGHSVSRWSAAALIAAALAGCDQQNDSQTGNNTSTAAIGTGQAPAATAVTAGATQPAGPEMLSTVGLYDEQPTTKVPSRNGTFAIENISGVDTLTLNGKPTRYTPGGADVPASVEANDSISLIGVFELPDESVAWVVINGGAACAGTHILIGARNGLPLPGQEIPGCDDRGTMRKVGDKITFEAGGSEGTYQDGMISVARNATKVEPAPQP